MKSTPRVGIADKSVGDACFNDWKRFAFVLREIASGDNGRPLSSVDAQKRAQAVLDECGYTWPLTPVAAAAKPHTPTPRCGQSAPRSHEAAT